MPEPSAALLVQQDRNHLIHPQYHPDDHEGAIIFASGKDAVLKSVDGKEYIDGLSCLWNVAIGHGRPEMADAAAEQMRELQYANNYTGFSNIPAIQLATKISEITYPDLNAVFFTSGGAESNESAFKTARWYWKMVGKPEKTKVISRMFGYHGVTLAAMSATGLPVFWPPFEPRVPGFVHINPPYPWMFDTDGADELEKKILEEGPETVAAFIAEPVMGAGGVVPPPDDYFPRVRAICDKYEVLFIADEVITGFGRTGKWFGLEHWDVQPDIVSFAKIVTSGYLPLGGIIISDELHNTMLNAPIDKKYMHAYTYSGHATCCAVGLKNIEIIENENLVERAGVLGARLLAGLKTLEDIPCVGEVRGLGLMCAVELAADRATKKPFEPGLNMGGRVIREGKLRGVILRNRGDVIMMAPPYVTTEEQIDTIVSVLRESLIAATAAVAR